MPRCARAPSDQTSCTSTPPTPVTRSGARNSVAAKPVPQMIVSTSCRVPSAVRSPVGSTEAIASETTATWSRARAGYQSLPKSTRLQPSG